jgi:hypothetical protein
MLETVQNYINDSPSTSFYNYYQAYICKLQDDILSSECKSAQFITNPCLFTKIINSAYKELTKVDKL